MLLHDFFFVLLFHGICFVRAENDSLCASLKVMEKKVGNLHSITFEALKKIIQGPFLFQYVIQDGVLLFKSGIVMTTIILMFFIHPFIPGLNIGIGKKLLALNPLMFMGQNFRWGFFSAWIALFGATWLLVLADPSDLEAILHRIEWATLIFFAALFVLMKVMSTLVPGWNLNNKVWADVSPETQISCRLWQS